MEKNNILSSIRKKILAALEINDEGKVLAFLDFSVKSLKREIKAREINLSTDRFDYEKTLESLTASLEDAKEELETAYYVDVESLKTSTDRADYFKTYMSNIKAAEEKVRRLEERVKETEESFAKKEEKTKEQIGKLEEYISKLS